jgi:ribosomal-protein-alanine N-acetyltransferase
VVPRTRPVTPEDAAVLAELLQRSREYLAPWDAARPDGFYTVEGQVEVIAALLTDREQGRAEPHVILDDDGAVAGRATLNTIVRGAFQSCSLGYWVATEAAGRGLATAAAGAMVEVAFDRLDLHRVEASTLRHNVRSQRVLERNGFVRFGLAPQYLKIAGRWQDHVLWQRVRPEVEDAARDDEPRVVPD